jgi:hypothetical protein
MSPKKPFLNGSTFASPLRYLLLLVHLLPIGILQMATAESGQPVPQAPLDRYWWQPMDHLQTEDYLKALEWMIPSFEQSSGIRLDGTQGQHIALKIYTHSGAGIATPKALVHALILFLETRGFDKAHMILADLELESLWRAGYLSSRAEADPRFMGVRVVALNTPEHQDPNWFYDSPLPSQQVERSSGKAGDALQLYAQDLQDDRKSYLPTPLLFECDYWINLPVVTDHPHLGINGVLANATLWNVTNQFRFLTQSAAASAAIAEIAAIPELNAKWIFSIVPLEKMQFMGGPIFNSGYVKTLPELYLSANPVILDRIFLEKINRARESMGFSAVSPLPPVFEYAESLGLGTSDPEQVERIQK